MALRFIRPAKNVSVVVPVYNECELLDGCLKSTHLQVDINQIQLIVIDDGSDPPYDQNIKDIVDKHLKPGDFYCSTRHGNAAVARNLGATQAIHPYLFFLDADTILRPDAFKRLIEVLEKSNEASYAYGDYEFNDFAVVRGRPYDPDFLQTDNYISTMSMIRRDDFVGFDEDLERFQDWALWLKLMRMGKEGVYCPGVLFKTYQKLSGISNKPDGLLWRKRVLERYAL
jgi:glycosyltransferase involved in cell wall biosynthesis